MIGVEKARQGEKYFYFRVDGRLPIGRMGPTRDEQSKKETKMNAGTVVRINEHCLLAQYAGKLGHIVSRNCGRTTVQFGPDGNCTYVEFNTNSLDVVDGIGYDRFLRIDDANSSGQGFNPHHAENPHHATLTEFGWQYSHTTRIGTVDGSFYAHHTYIMPNTDWTVGIDSRPGEAAHTGRIGSGRRMTYFRHRLRAWLNRKQKEFAKMA